MKLPVEDLKEVNMKIEENLAWILDYEKISLSYKEAVPDKCISRNEWLERGWNEQEKKIKKY